MIWKVDFLSHIFALFNNYAPPLLTNWFSKSYFYTFWQLRTTSINFPLSIWILGKFYLILYPSLRNLTTHITIPAISWLWLSTCLPGAWENFPQGLVLFVRNGGKSQREKSQESKCNVTMTQLLLNYQRYKLVRILVDL